MLCRGPCGFTSSETFLTSIEINEDFYFVGYDKKLKKECNFLFGTWEVDNDCQQEISDSGVAQMRELGVM